MGLFSKRERKTPDESSRPTKLPTRPAPTDAGYESAKRFMHDWTSIVGQGDEEAHWQAFTRFGQIGDATQAASNSASANVRFMGVANDRFGGDFAAFLDWPWQNWLAMAEEANTRGDFELVVRIFFFAYFVKTSVTFDIDKTTRVGYEQAQAPTYRAIAREANAAATQAPPTFAVVERVIEPPVSRSTIISGTQQIIGA